MKKNDPVAWVAPDSKGGVQFGKNWSFSPVETAQATMPLYSSPVSGMLNMNHMVSVTLTAAGARVYLAWLAQFPGDFREKAKAGDKLRMPLWELARIFGPSISMGMPEVHFVDNEVDFGLPEWAQESKRTA